MLKVKQIPFMRMELFTTERWPITAIVGIWKLPLFLNGLEQRFLLKILTTKNAYIKIYSVLCISMTPKIMRG